MDEHRVHRAGRVRAGLASRPASQAGPSSPLNCWTTREGRSRLSGPWVSGSRPWSGAHLLHHQEAPLATPGTERDESALEEWHRLSSGSPRHRGSPLGTRVIVASGGRRRVHARRIDRRRLPAHGLAFASSRCSCFCSGLSIEFPRCCGQGRGSESAPAPMKTASAALRRACRVRPVRSSNSQRRLNRKPPKSRSRMTMTSSSSMGCLLSPRGCTSWADGGRMETLARFASAECFAVGLRE
jgi:hypothetical protein